MATLYWKICGSSLATPVEYYGRLHTTPVVALISRTTRSNAVTSTPSVRGSPSGLRTR